MFRRIWLVPAVCITLGLSACGGGSAAHHEAKKLQNNPQFQADVARVKKDFQACVSKVGLHKDALITCMVPGGKAHAKVCVQNAVQNDGFLTKHKRERLAQDIVGCGVR